MTNPERGEVILKVGGKDVLFTANFSSIMKIERNFRDFQGRTIAVMTLVPEFLMQAATSIPPISDLVLILHGMCQDASVTLEDIYEYLSGDDEPDSQLQPVEMLTARLTPLIPAIVALVDKKGVKLHFKEDPKEAIKPKATARKKSKRAPTSENS